jgi:hypothetical protein
MRNGLHRPGDRGGQRHPLRLGVRDSPGKIVPTFAAVEDPLDCVVSNACLAATAASTWSKAGQSGFSGKSTGNCTPILSCPAEYSRDTSPHLTR